MRADAPPPAARAAAGFARRFGGEPDGVWRAPGRVNLIGDHTDYNDGFVLPFAIDRETAVAARRRDDGMLRCTSEERGDAPDTAVGELRPSSDWWGYAYGVVHELSAALEAAFGADLSIASSVPAGAGLSSSAALECSVAAAVADLGGLELDRTELALAAQRAENDFVGVPCGVMDQMTAMRGRAGQALFLDTRSLAFELLPLPDLQAVVIETGTTHELAESEYAARRRTCEEAARTLGVPALRDVTVEDLSEAEGELDPVAFRRVRHVVTENRRVEEAAEALRSGDLDALAAAMAASHVSLRDDYEVSSPELDLAVDAALEAGAVAARMTGAGFGGAAIALVDGSRMPALAAHVAERFALAAFAAPTVLRVRSADGASRLP